MSKRYWHWPEKRRIIIRILDASSPGDVVDKVYTKASEQSLKHDTAVAMRKWHKSRPYKKYLPFLKLLAEKLGCAADVTGSDILHSSLEEFIDLLPEPHRTKYRQSFPRVDNDALTPSNGVAVVSMSASASAERSSSPHRRIVEVLHDIDLVTLPSGARAGHLDTRHYYSTPEAAEVWRELVAAESYHTYDQCKDALRALTETEQWKQALCTSSVRSAVMLAGGGAPSKDLILVRSLVGRDHTSGAPLQYSLVDINYPMLEQSSRILERAKASPDLRDRVEFKYVVKDVLALGSGPAAFVRDKSVLFAITGGTIGNLREAAFFRSLNLTAHAGDLLIVSVDTIGGQSSSTLRDALVKKYDHPEMRNFVAPGVRAVLDAFGLHESLRDGQARVVVRVVENACPALSDVPGSWSVTLHLTANDRDVTLLTSARYDLPSLVSFAAGFGWEHLCTVPAPSNRQFVQMLLRRAK